MRKCPRCTFFLDVVEHNHVELDYCRRCAGVFLDPGEETEMFGAIVSPEVWKHSSVSRGSKKSTLKCPEDRTQFVTYIVKFRGKSVKIDLCPSCAGMWLDPGEGKKLRDIVMEAGQSEETNLAHSEPGVGSYIFQLLSGFPIEVWNPRRRIPLLTISIIGILYAIFTIQMLTAGMDIQLRLIEVFGLVPSEILGEKRLWTLITSAFLHGGIIHVLGNTYFLYVFGDNVEDFLGKRRFLLLYIASAIAGSILQTAFQSDPMIPVIGASGAVAGLMGAYFIIFPRVKLYTVWFFIRFRLGVIWYFGFWLAFNVLMALTGGEGVAWISHIGGFIMGIFIAFWYRPRPLAEQLQQ